MTFEITAMKKINKWPFGRVLMAMVIAALVASCAVTEPRAVEEDFGKSVNQMIFVQTYDKAAANSPPVGPVKGMDGMMGENILQEYRKGIAREKEVKNEITINVGQ